MSRTCSGVSCAEGEPCREAWDEERLRVEVRALRRERARLRKALRKAHAAMQATVAAWNDLDGDDCGEAAAACARAMGLSGPALAPRARRDGGKR